MATDLKKLVGATPSITSLREKSHSGTNE